jgi:hypothetical protein
MLCAAYLVGGIILFCIAVCVSILGITDMGQVSDGSGMSTADFIVAAFIASVSVRLFILCVRR